MANILNIVIDPAPSLRERSKEIDTKKLSSQEFQRLCADMTITMNKKDGVGLAAPQVGKNVRMFVVSTKDGPIHVINPLIIKKSLLREWGEEGCLSVPDTFGQVKRHKKINCKYINKKGQTVTVEAEGLLARVIQHETDHLDGILFIDKAKKIKKMKNYSTGNKENIN